MFQGLAHISVVSLGLMQVREALDYFVAEFTIGVDAIDEALEFVAEWVGRELAGEEDLYVREHIQAILDGETPKPKGRRPAQRDWESWLQTCSLRRGRYPKHYEMGGKDAPKYWDRDEDFEGWTSWPKVVVKDASGAWLPLKEVAGQLIRWFGLDEATRMLKRPLTTKKMVDEKKGITRTGVMPGWFQSGWVLMRDIKIALGEGRGEVLDLFTSKKGNPMKRVVLPVGITDINVCVPDELEMGLQFVCSDDTEQVVEEKYSAARGRILDEKVLHYFVRTGRSPFKNLV